MAFELRSAADLDHGTPQGEALRVPNTRRRLDDAQLVPMGICNEGKPGVSLIFLSSIFLFSE